MKSLTNELKAAISARLDTCSPMEIARIVGAIAANEQIEAAGQVAALSSPKGLTTATDAPRFVNLDKNAKPTTGEHVAVYDRTTGLVWSRGVIAREVNHASAMKAAAEFTLFGKTCRAPTLQERFGINDYARHSPALDTVHFAKEEGWEWTSTIDASSPSDDAWLVSLGSGYCSRGGQSNHGSVRAVLAGQS